MPFTDFRNEMLEFGYGLECEKLREAADKAKVAYISTLSDE